MSFDELNLVRGVDLAPALDAIISRNSVRTVFQPLVSAKQRRIVGYELLSRARDDRTGEPIPPEALFDAADRAGRTLEVDRLCRRSAFSTFASHCPSSDILASVNLDVSAVTPDTVGSNVVYDQVVEHGLEPGQVVIEIVEREIRDVATILRFVEVYRERGFLIALDDVGAGFANLDRVPLIQPDIINTDRSLIDGIASDFRRRGLVESIVSLAHTTGALVIAEGVETREQAAEMLGLGADFLQGFLFARPAAYSELDLDGVQGEIDAAASLFRHKTVAEIRDRRERYRRSGAIVAQTTELLGGDGAHDIDHALDSAVAAHGEVECMYVLDDAGVQLSATVFGPEQRIRPVGPLFRPGVPGTDHSYKDYCFSILAGLPTFTTLPYISLASGKLCVTIATRYRDREGAERILCTDLLYDRLSG